MSRTLTTQQIEELERRYLRAIGEGRRAANIARLCARRCSQLASAYTSFAMIQFAEADHLQHRLQRAGVEI